MKKLKYLLIAILFAAFAEEGFGQQCNNTGPIVTDVSCDGTNDGKIEIQFAAGCIHYITWSNGATATDVITNLTCGTYSVTITYPNVFVPEIHTGIVVHCADLITYTVSQQDNSCANACQGYASVSASSPSGVSYLWNTGATSNQINNLCDGNYSVTITNGSGCTKVRNFTIGTDPTLNTNWQKNTDNPSGANDVIKRTLTDAQGNLYVMGEFINQTSIDGYLINSGSINNQKAIFVAKYTPCGDLDWVVNSQNFSTYYDIEGFDIDFTQNQQDITLFAKWDNTNPAVQEYSFISSNGSSNTFANPGSSKDVFSISFDVATGTIPNNNTGIDFSLNFSDKPTSGKVVGFNIFIGGQFSGNASIKRFQPNGSWLSNVIYDQNSGNVISDFEIDGLNNVYAAINLESSSAILDPFVPISISSQGDAIMVIAPISSSILPPSFINPAYGTDITIHDVDMNLSTLGNTVTAVGEFSGHLPGWQTGGIQINSNIKTAVIAQFQANNLVNTATYQMDGQIQNASATAVITNPDAITVTGVMNGNQAQITTSSGVIGTNTGSGAGANTMWVARFLYSTANGDWMIGSDGVQDVVVNDISYHAPTGLFYTGGQYMDDIFMPPFSNLNFPYPGSGQRLGFIIRGGDQYTPGQGAFYKTSANELPKENIVEAVTGFIIYPNPNNGQFKVEINTEMDEEIHLTIYTVTGQMVFQKTIRNPNKGMSIPVQPDGLSSGFYTIQIQQGNKTLFQKMIVE